MKEKQFHCIEDFWQDESFIAWTLGNDERLAAHWEQWQREHPEQADMLQDARRLLLAVKVTSHTLPAEEIQQKVSAMLHALPGDSRSVRWRTWLAAAIIAGVILLSGVAWQLTRHSHDTSSPLATIKENNLTETMNHTGHVLTVSMKDGSNILLEPGARIRYSKTWGQERRVYLEGKATFDVQQQAQSPFIVDAGDIETRVLGTVFSVEAGRQQGQVLIAVQHGKVAVKKSKYLSDNREEEEMILLANQEASYETTSGLLSKTLIPAPLAQVAVKHQEDFIFTDIPVTTVFEKLEKVYAIQLVYDTTVLKSCTITANLNKEAFYDKLDLICKALGLSYQEINGQLIINGKGCGGI